MPFRRGILALCALLGLASAAAAAPAPGYAEGYAAAVLQEWGAAGATATVSGATMTVRAGGLDARRREGVERALKRAPGVDAVLFEDGAPARGGLTFLPRLPVFDPLIADPRWPRLSGTMVRYNHDELGRVWAANFGGSLPLVGGDARWGGQWQWGAQASVFTLWNMDTVSDDHINADYLVGLPFTWRWGRFSAMARLYHISSHLGDEYMLTHPRTARVNLSYEALDAVLSYQVLDSVRVYGGGGRMIRRDPKDTRPGSLQAGAEYMHPRAYWHGRLRPVAALDLQKHEKSGWEATDVSARAGVELMGHANPSRRAMLLFEYFHGKDPNGQFFRRDVQHAGFGLSVYY
jgi:hypothetical protein